jgi:hypothetical protein
MFVNSLEFPYFVRIFDLFLAQGIGVLFRTSIAVLKIMQKDLLKSDFGQTMLQLKSLGQFLKASPEQLISCAKEFSLSEKRLAQLSREYDERRA